MAEQEQIERTTVTTITTAHEEPKPTLLSSILAIVGLVILVIVIIWGLVHLASLSSSFFSSLFARPAASITLTAPSSVTSRTDFTVSWNYTPTTAGSYAFLYQCESGFQLQTVNQNGVSDQIPCGTSFVLPSNAASLTLTPILSLKSAVDVPMSVVFIPDASTSSSVQGTASVLVNPASIATVTPAPSTTPAPAKPRATGPADLSVRIISVNADQYGNGTAVFDIENIGSGTSHSYYFEAQLPTNAYGQTYGSQMQSYTYNSPAQISLASGDHVTSTLHFTQAQQGGIFSVTVDPSDAVNDSNRTNNYAYQTLTMPYNYNYNQQYNYQQTYPSYTY